MKVDHKRFIFLKIIILIFELCKCEQESMQYYLQNVEGAKYQVSENKGEQPYIIPHTVKRLEDTIGDRRIAMSVNRMVQPSPMMSSPIIQPRLTATNTYIQQQQIRPIPCPCATEVRCRPCNGLIEPPIGAYGNPATCPCAPPVSCPKCPPVSLIHEIAAKKALQDQQLASSLKTHSEKITKYFDMIIKYSNDVVNSENEAVKAAKQMEEASLKALFARKNMVNISEKARLIAKTSIVENRPCIGLGCPGSSPENLSFYSEKIFPVEVENIKEYMDDTFTTNLNGFNSNPSGSDYNSLDSIENEADGKINIHKIRYNNGNNFGSRNPRGFLGGRVKGWNTSIDFSNGNNLMGMNNINTGVNNMNNQIPLSQNMNPNQGQQQQGIVPNNQNMGQINMDMNLMNMNQNNPKTNLRAL